MHNDQHVSFDLPFLISCKAAQMLMTVELVVWALILTGLRGAVTAASHLLFPTVRWFLSVTGVKDDMVGKRKAAPAIQARPPI